MGIVHSHADRDLVIVWQPDHHCDCRFADLFDYSGPVLETVFVDDAGARGMDVYNYMPAEPGSRKDAELDMSAPRDIYVRSAFVVNAGPAAGDWDAQNRFLRALRPVAAVLGLGIGCLNAYLFPSFPLWESFWTILTFPLFLVSGVFFIYEDLPPLGQQILWYNPLIHITGQMRVGFYPTYDPSYISPAYVFAFGLIPMVLGLMLLRRYYKRILNL